VQDKFPDCFAKHLGHTVELLNHKSHEIRMQMVKFIGSSINYCYEKEKFKPS
jgi:hypothetical protein